MKKNKALGRGLDALFKNNETPSETESGVSAVALKDIRINPNQPRKEFEQSGMDELIASVKENGIIQALTVRSIDDAYELIAGERRLRAAKACGLEEVPVHILELDGNLESLEMALVENVQREDLNPVEEAEAYTRMAEEFGMTQQDIAKRVSKSRVVVANSLRLLKLPPDVLASLRKGEIRAGHARAILSLSSSSQQSNLLQRILREKLSVRQCEALVKRMQDMKDKPPPAPKSNPLRHVESQLVHTFGTKVRVNKNRNGKGKISIDFFSDEDLNRILALIETISEA